ncbi:MAG: ATP-dependent DNA helicase RecG [Candidatus Omnitrophota bacterium]|jgi:ATP-dependent DNA helicase RecG
MQDLPLRYLKGIGPKRAEIFSSLGINTVEDLLYYFPRRYEDRRNLSTISALKAGETYTIKAQVLLKKERRPFRGKVFSIIEIEARDDTGTVTCVWFNQPYVKNYFTPGSTVILHGKVESYGLRLQMSNPEFEVVNEEDESLCVNRIVPVYTLPQGFTQRHFRHLVKLALDGHLPKLQDTLAFDIRSRHNLLNLAQALINIHFPNSDELRRQAYERLAFEEFFLFELPLILRKLKRKEKRGIIHKIDAEFSAAFIKGLAFELTDAQKKVVEEIRLDMMKPQTMQRLLQGDVGSGKTVVALIAALFAIGGGYQVAFMVPTEILAKQHFIKISLQAKQIRICLLTGSASAKDKEKAYRGIREGRINLVIGTHALLEEGVVFKNLGFVVIDEQHKFGVSQRTLLPKKGPNPDILIMTATPIPRTLAITLYGDLDISVINELPPGRKPVRTLHFVPDEVDKAYNLAKDELKKGRQAYIIYPVIEESYALDMQGAKKMFARLRNNEFKGYRLGIIHGKMKEAQQDETMRKFINREIDLLVSTTVLEVGIDIPNATCMIIENTERFGLSQLHQLRGRIGRGAEASVCILVSGAASLEASSRIKAMVNFSDGFRIAEEDLKIRGPGEFFGSRQHGLSELRIGDPLLQMHLLKSARDEAIKLLNSDPDLSLRQNALLKERLLKRFPEYKKLMTSV